MSHRGETWNADIAYFTGGLQWVIDVAVVNVDSDTSINAGSRAEDIDDVRAQGGGGWVHDGGAQGGGVGGGGRAPSRA